MIIGSDEPFDVGDIGHGITNKDGDYHPYQPFVVVRVASFEAWKADCEACGIDLREWPNLMRRKFYYEVSVD